MSDTIARIMEARPTVTASESGLLILVVGNRGTRDFDTWAYVMPESFEGLDDDEVNVYLELTLHGRRM